jgi:hypothetical protein
VIVVKVQMLSQPLQRWHNFATEFAITKFSIDTEGN